MTQNGSYLDSPWKRAFVGFLFLCAGVGLHFFSENSNWIVKIVCAKPPGVICEAAKLAVLDFGLKSVAYTLIFLGCLLIVLYDFVASLLGQILSFALNHVSNSANVVLHAMERNRLTREESGQIIVETISRFKGFRDELSESFATFLCNNLVKQNDTDNGFWRHSFSSYVDVKPVETGDGVDGTKYLKWIETSRYTVSNKKRDQIYKYSSFSSVEIDSSSSLDPILKTLRYDVQANGKKIVSFEDVRSKIDCEKLIDEGGVKEGNWDLTFSEGYLSIVFEDSLPVKGLDIDIVVDEESFLSVEDNVYEMAFYEPTKGFTFRFNLPEGYDIYHRGASGLRFGSTVNDDVEISEDVDNRVRVDGRTWALPGIVAILVWKKKQ